MYSSALPYHAHAQRQRQQQQQAGHAQPGADAATHQTQYQSVSDYQDAPQFVIQDDIDEVRARVCC